MAPTTFTTWTMLPRVTRSGPLRLVSLAGDVALYQASTTRTDASIAAKTGCPVQVVLMGLAIVKEKTPPPAITVPQLLPSGPAFDVAVDADNKIVVAIESFGGAVNALLVARHDGDGSGAVSMYGDRNDYRFPRFVRGAVLPGQALTAAINGAGLALMPQKPSVPDDATGVRSVALAPGSDGVLIATDTPPDGPISGTLFARTETPYAPLSPTRDFGGTLAMMAVTVGQRPGPATPLFDPEGTYAFDAEAQPGTALVVASTRQGPQMLSVDLTSHVTKPIAWPDGYPTPNLWIANPTVLAVAGGPGQKLVSFAFYEGTGATTAGIRYGQIDLAQLP